MADDRSKAVEKTAGTLAESLVGIFLPSPFAKFSGTFVEHVAIKPFLRFFDDRRNLEKIDAAFGAADTLFRRRCADAGYEDVASLPFAGLESLAQGVADSAARLDREGLVAVIRRQLFSDWGSQLSAEQL